VVFSEKLQRECQKNETFFKKKKRKGGDCGVITLPKELAIVVALSPTLA